MVTIRIKFDLLKYLRDNWGAPFIILFQALLLSSGGFLIKGDSALADKTAAYAYYSLVTGVALQLISFLMAGRRKAKRE